MKPIRKRKDLPPSRDPGSPRFYDPDWAAWEQPRRWPMRLAVTVALVAIVGLVTFGNFGSTVAPTTTKVVTSTTFPLPGSGVGQIQPIHRSGDGTAKTASFQLAGGVTVFEMACHCAANFAVALVEAGAPNRILANTTSTYKGVIAATLPAGTYSLTVAADQAWSITITQPRNEPVQSGTSFYTGTGPAVIGPFNVSPTSKFLIVNVPLTTAASQFSFVPADGGAPTVAMSNDGSKVDGPGTKPGFVDETITANVPRTGAYYLAFNSSGYWSVTFK